MSRYIPVYLSAGWRPRGWYVRDDLRSTRYAEVIVGGRHHTRIEAETEARRLEVSP